MKSTRWIQTLFGVGAFYDGLLGAGFLLAGDALFARFGVTPPNHWGYVQFAAALLLVFALMFWAVARDPIRNRNLIPYGILLKVSYCSVVGYHWLNGSIPNLWKPFAVCDLLFLLLFARAWAALAKASPVAKA